MLELVLQKTVFKNINIAKTVQIFNWVCFFLTEKTPK